MKSNQQVYGCIPENLPSYNDAHHANGYFVNNHGYPYAEYEDIGMGTARLFFKFFFGEKDVTREMPHRNPKSDFNLGNGIRNWWIGHATNLIQIKDKFILTDPIFEKSCSPLKIGNSR